MMHIREVYDTFITSLPDLETFVHNLSTNTVFLGFALLAVLGFLSYTLRSGFLALSRFLVRQYTVSMVVRNSDTTFRALAKYIETNNVLIRSRHLTSTSDEEKRVLFYLGDGRHLRWIKGRPFFLVKETSESKNLVPPETFTIYTIGRSTKPLRRMIQEGMSLLLDDTAGMLKIATWSYGWDDVYKLPRPLDTIILEQSTKNDLLSDISWFLESKDWFQKLGIPYHRGYLFHGPPGTGKTSLVQALASYFEHPIYLISLDSCTSDTDLADRANSVPSKSFILLEDIDSCLATWSRSKELSSTVVEEPATLDTEEESTKGTSSSKKGVTTSGLLNLLDGVASTDGRVIFMTTNTPQVLDAALTRPGRIDRQFYLGYPDSELIGKMYYHFFPDATEEEAESFTKTHMGESPATLQGELMKMAMDDVSKSNR